MSVRDTPERKRKGVRLGLLDMVILAMTVPLMCLAAGDIQDPQLPLVLVTVERAAGAAVSSLLWLLAQPAPWPGRDQFMAPGAARWARCRAFPCS